MAIDQSRTSNALGVRIPVWIIKQLEKRSKELSVKDVTGSSKINDNVRFRGNRTAWVRMVSSIDLVDPTFYAPVVIDPIYGDVNVIEYRVQNKPFDYFKNTLGLNIQNQKDLAKLFILQGGVSKYQSTNNNQFSYDLRNGFKESYNVTGTEDEIKNYGYRPMPGITSVRIQTTGKLGSIKSAEVQLRVWDKAQLDIIDTLYFKLGYTMLLEWGHTYYYDSNTGELKETESMSINPFEDNLTKEDIYNKISNNVRNSQGNYDAMLGMVTNFNFTYNQEGGYDCTVRLISLGALISNMKMNNPRYLPDLQPLIVKKLFNRLEEIRKQEIINQRNAAAPPPSTDTTTTTTTEKPVLAIDFYNQYLYDQNKKQYTFPANVFRNYPSSQTFQFPENSNFNVITPKYSFIFFIKKLNGFIVQSRSDFSLKIDSQFLKNTLSKNKIDLTNSGTWTPDKIVLAEFTGLLGAARLGAGGLLVRGLKLIDALQPKTTADIEYVGANLRKYNITITRDIYAYVDKDFGSNIDVGTADRYALISDKDFGEKALSFLSYEAGNDYKFTLEILPEGDNYVTPKFTISRFTEFDVNVPVVETVEVGAAETKEVSKQISAKAKLNFTISFTDTDLIKSLFSPADIKQPQDFKTYESQTKKEEAAAPAQPETAPTPAEPPITVEDVQTAEAERYKSAFEVMVRILQLYSLDNSIDEGIEKDHKIKVLNLLEGNTYKELTKTLFSFGLFANMLGPDEEVKDLPNRTDVVNYSRLAKNADSTIAQKCAEYDRQMIEGTIVDKEEMMKIRALFGFHFGLLGNEATATNLLDKKCFVDYGLLMRTFTVPYEFETGIFEGTQLNHPVYLPLGLIIMILNHICSIYDTKNSSSKKDITPLVYFDFNHKTNLCLSNSKHLSTNPYEILIPFQGTNEDFVSILEPTVIAWARGTQSKDVVLAIKPTKEKKDGDEEGATPVYTPNNEKDGKEIIKDRISGGLPLFKFLEEGKDVFRGRTMNILVSCDYLLKTVSTFYKNNGSGDVYIREFLEQILFDINKSLGDINIFRLSYDDKGNVAHIVDDQMTPNLEERYPLANEDPKDPENRSRLPLFGNNSIARNLEIRTEVSSKLSNMIAISANSSYEDQSSLSKSAESFGFYNLSYVDRYVPSRTEFTSSVVLPTDTMIRSTLQFNEAIKTFYGSAKPAYTAVAHATNYYIQRMSKIKSSEKGTRASAMIPVSLNFSIDGMSGFGMGQSFTIDPEFLPYTYNLANTNPFGEQDRVRTVAFVMVGLDHTIESNQWISSVRSNMIFGKNDQDFEAKKLEQLQRPSGLIPAPKGSNLHGEVNDLSKASTVPRNTDQTISLKPSPTSKYIFGESKSGIDSSLKLKAHGAREENQKGQWQSTNAWDLMVPAFTPVYAIFDGKVTNINYLEQGTFIWGYRFTLVGQNNSAFYTHLDRATVAEGTSVKKGDLIGFVGQPPSEFKWSPHLHLAFLSSEASKYLGSGGLIL